MQNKHFTVHIERISLKPGLSEWRDLFFFVSKEEEARICAEDFCNNWWNPDKDIITTLKITGEAV